MLSLGADSRPTSPQGPPGDSLSLRALVTTKEAGVIIGKGGKNVADLREQTGVKAGVSKVVPGVHERVLSISGSIESIAKVGFIQVRGRRNANPDGTLCNLFCRRIHSLYPNCLNLSPRGPPLV